MPNRLLPGVLSTNNTPRPLLPVAIALIALVVGVGYFAIRSTADAIQVVTPSMPVAVAPQPSRAAVTSTQRDDLALHLARVRSNIGQAIDEVRRAERAAETSVRSLESLQLAVESTRARRAMIASTTAVNLLMRSIEELDVARNALTKEE